VRNRVKLREGESHDAGEVSIYDDDESMPLAVRERRQTNAIKELFREKAQWGEFYRVYGMVLFLLGAYWLTVPFYNVICQQFGFTMSTSHKEYKFKEAEVDVFRKFRISFMAHTQDEIPWEFQPSTPTIMVNAGETALSFYKVFNRSDKPIAGIAIYQIYPEEASLYFNKI
jgi:cytochrome c oxidase assembly protein subunit 11